MDLLKKHFRVDVTDSELDRPIINSNLSDLKSRLRNKIFIFIGGPGAGKGTQASALQEKLGLRHVSTGDLFRLEVRNDTEIGKVIGPIMASGGYVPKEFADKILYNRLSLPDTENGVILDGFPRSLDHLRDLDDILLDLLKVSKQFEIAGAFFIDTSDDECIRRISGRRHCPKCSSTYNILSEAIENNQCANCGNKLEYRVDDNEMVLRKRLALFRDTAPPLLQELANRDLLYFMSGEASLGRLTEKIIEVMVYPKNFQKPRSPFQKLLYHLRYSKAATQEYQGLADSFRSESLEANISKRTGVTRRFIYLSTTNRTKLEEFERDFDRYGIEILQIPEIFDDSRNAQEYSMDIPAFLQTLLSSREKNAVPLAVLREETSLNKPNSSVRSTFRVGVEADHLSVLKSWTLTETGNNIIYKEYHHITRGVIRSSENRCLEFGGVFGWDDIFVVKATGKTYQEHKMWGLKISSRDMVISKFLAEKIYYKHLKSLHFKSLPIARPVDFAVDVADYVLSDVHYMSAEAVRFGYKNMLHHVLNEGIFYKAADTRLEANYWQPGLNAGLPLVEKKDPIHELTFQMHDLGHFLMKDLIFTGSTSSLHRSVYIIARMISEAITIMLADGLFIETMVRRKIPYDYSTRQIYPLFKDLNLDFDDSTVFLKNLRALLKASVDYVVKGDDSSFRHLLDKANGGSTSIEKFISKYKPFFVSDYQWTAHNYENMESRSDEMRVWWNLTEPIRNELDLPLETIDAFIDKAGLSIDIINMNHNHISDVDLGFTVLVDRVFETIFQSNIAPIFNPAREPILLMDKEHRNHRGYLRWIIGQLGIFSRFHSLKESTEYLSTIVALVKSKSSIESIRLVFEQYLGLLLNQNLISLDDYHNFAETYPLFEPFYVTYDKNEEYPDLLKTAIDAISYQSHQTHQINNASQVIGRQLSKMDIKYYQIMSMMTEFSGGQIEDGLFISKPGILLLAHSVLVDPYDRNRLNVSAHMEHATFLLCGISIETSLELVAHSEASCARLTTSKTSAMNLPFHRIQGSHHQEMKGYLKLVQRFRTSYENTHNPRKWTNGIELYNMTNCGCKATILFYTMNLADYHKLFIGRMGEAGNELEVREVVRSMALCLHQHYPEHIRTPDEYLAMSNGMKYIPSSKKDSIINESIHQNSGAELICEIIMTTRITLKARKLFEMLNMDVNMDDCMLLSEFRSRVTYLSFSNETEGRAVSGPEYLNKMIHEYQHLSIVSACRLSIMINKVLDHECTMKLHEIVLRNDGHLNKESTFLIISLNLKSFHKLLKEIIGIDRLMFEALVAVLNKNYGFVIGDAASYA